MLRKIFVVLLGFVLLEGCSSKVDQKKYENLYHAAKAIEGSVAVGVDYQKFGELLQNLSTELSIANDKATFSIASDKAKSDSEKELLKNYLDALAAYQESALVWKNKIDGARYDWIPKGRIYVENELRPIIAKYSLSIESHVMRSTGHKFETISGDAVQVIWAKAHEYLEKATKIYYGADGKS